MPRKIPTQVDQSLSRLLRGGYLKEAPAAFPAMLNFPPSALPPRHIFQHTPGDICSPSSSSETLDATAFSENIRRNRLNSSKKSHSIMPKLFPQPIVYLADRIRQRFYQDHPWEALRPRTLVEGAILQEVSREKDPSVTELLAWGRNPGPEEVIACTIHLHKHHSLSLSQAYHHTLCSYHALRAEFENANRAAILEARAYGAIFAVGTDGQETAAVEIERGHRKEAEELEKGAEFFRGAFAAEGQGDGQMSSISITDSRTGTVRVKSASQAYTRGREYLKAALQSRDGIQEMESIEATGEIIGDADQLQSSDSLMSKIKDQYPFPNEAAERVQVGQEHQEQ